MRGCRSGCRSRRARTWSAAAFLRKIGAGTHAAPAVPAQLRRHLRFTGRPHIETLTITGPFDATGPGDTPSRRRIFACRPSTGSPTRSAVPREILTTLARRAYRRPVDTDDLARCWRSIGRAVRKGASTRASSWRCGACWPARSSCSASSASPPSAAPGAHLSASATSSWRRGCRSSSGAASPTTSCSMRAGAGQAAHSRRCSSAQVRRMLADPRADALVAQLRRAVAARPQPAQHRRRTRTCSRTSTTTCGRPSSARSSCSSAASSARIAASSIC